MLSQTREDRVAASEGTLPCIALVSLFCAVRDISVAVTELWFVSETRSCVRPTHSRFCVRAPCVLSIHG